MKDEVTPHSIKLMSKQNTFHETNKHQNRSIDPWRHLRQTLHDKVVIKLEKSNFLKKISIRPACSISITVNLDAVMSVK